MRAALESAATVVPLDADYTRLRSIKSDEELAVLRHAAALTDASAAALLDAAVPGADRTRPGRRGGGQLRRTGATNHIHYVAATEMAAPDRCAPAQWPSDRRLTPDSLVMFELSTTWGPDYPGSCCAP